MKTESELCYIFLPANLASIGSAVVRRTFSDKKKSTIPLKHINGSSGAFDNKVRVLCTFRLGKIKQ